MPYNYVTEEWEEDADERADRNSVMRERVNAAMRDLNSPASQAAKAERERQHEEYLNNTDPARVHESVRAEFELFQGLYPGGTVRQWREFKDEQERVQRREELEVEAREKAAQEAARRDYHKKLREHVEAGGVVNEDGSWGPGKGKKSQPEKPQSSGTDKPKTISSTMTPRAVLRDPRVSPHEYKVAAAIADTINYGKFHDGQTTKVSQADLARRYNLDERTVNEAVKRLEALGYIEVDRRPGRGGTWFRFRPEACEIAPHA